MAWIDVGTVAIGDTQYRYFPGVITISNSVTLHFNIDNSIGSLSDSYFKSSLNRLLIYRDLRDVNDFIYSEYLGLFYIQNRNEVLTIPGFNADAFADYRIRVRRILNRRQTSFFVNVSLSIFPQSNNPVSETPPENPKPENPSNQNSRRPE